MNQLQSDYWITSPPFFVFMKSQFLRPITNDFITSRSQTYPQFGIIRRTGGERLRNGKEGIAPHRPHDNSLMTVLVLNAIIEKKGKDVAQLIQECPQCKLESIATYEKMMKANKKRMEQQRLNNERKKALKSLNDELNVIFERETPIRYHFKITIQHFR